MAYILCVLVALLAGTRASRRHEDTFSTVAETITQQLQRVAFRNSGTTRKGDRYSWQLIEPTGGQKFYYLEPQNVTSLHDKWGQWGASSDQRNSGRRYKFLLPAGPPPPAPPPAPPATCKVLSTMDAHDIPGHDGGEVQKLPSGQDIRTVNDC